MQKNVFTNHFFCILAAVAVLMTFSCGGLLTSEKAKLEKGTIRINLPETGARIGASKDDVDYYLISIVSETSGTIAVSSGKYTGGTFQTKVLPGSYSVIVQGIDEDDSRYGDIKWPLFIGRTNGVTVTADKESTAQIKMKLFELHASGTTYLSARDLEYFDWGSGKLPELPYPFDGWYTDRSCTTQITEFPATDDEFFASPYLNFNNYLTYKLHDTVEIMEPGTDGSAGTDATYVLFGDFPQSKLTGQSIDFTFDKKPSYNGWYVGSDGNYYEKVEDEYYKVEPIRWRVVDRQYNGQMSCLLVAENMLTASQFDHYNGSSYYEDSSIRAYLNGLSFENFDSELNDFVIENKWLNKGFLQTAFTQTAQNTIKTTTVDNGEMSIMRPGISFPSGLNYYQLCDNTQDKIFLLSAQEASSEDYFENDAARVRTGTAYEQKTAEINAGESSITDTYWLRSPTGYYADYAQGVYSDGEITQTMTAEDTIGIVPALCIALDTGRQSGDFYATGQNASGDGTTRSSPMNIQTALNAAANVANTGETPTIYLIDDVELSNTSLNFNVNIIGAGDSNGTNQVTITVGDGTPITFAENGTYSLKNVIIQVTGSETTSAIQNSGNLTLENCIIYSGSEDAIENGVVTATCTVKFSTVFVGSLAGIVSKGTLNVSNSEIMGLSADASTGIWCHTSGKASISSTVISNCHDSGLFIENGIDEVSLSHCTIKDCSISGCGGGIFTGSNLKIYNTYITNCTADEAGNSIYCQDSVWINDSFYSDGGYCDAEITPKTNNFEEVMIIPQ